MRKIRNSEKFFFFLDNGYSRIVMLIGNRYCLVLLNFCK